MLNKVIQKTVDYWTANDIIKEDDKDIYTYGLDLIFSTILNIMMVIITAGFMKQLPQTLAMLLIILPLQCCGGGYHAKTHLRCFLIMYIGWWIMMPLISYITPLIGTFIAFVSLIIVFTLAPVPHANVPMSIRRFNQMKVIVRYIALGGMIIGISLLWFRESSGVIGGSLIAGMGTVALSMIIAKVIYWWQGIRGLL